ncbi:MAG: C69 family dipeptidase [Paludibacteraceae bacterium]|nr:C69 family dipeptidase [Paludibacteraceae bacterium]
MKKIGLVILGCMLLAPVFACTNFLVGKAASVDGSTILSYAADSYTLYGFLHFSPAADHPAGSMREVRDWDSNRPQGFIPQVAHTYNVVGNMNEHQLTIGETTWGGREELWDTVGIDYGSLMYIALERCKTAREAIDCMVSLVEEYGYASEGETFSIADPNEIWIMDMIGKGAGQKGANWVATRIPDDCICGHANQARTTFLPLNTKRVTKGQRVATKDGNVMWSKDIIKFAREKGYFSGKDAEFNYQACFAPFDLTALYICEARVWSFFRHFSNDMDQYFDYASGKTFLATGGKEAGEPMPLYIRPNRKVSAQDIKDCMRDHYDGTPLDITQSAGSGPWNSKLRYGKLGFKVDSVQYWYERPTATQQTGWSYVSQMNNNSKTGGVFWFGVDDAATNVYMPFFPTMTRVPECLREGNGDLVTFSWTSAWWVFNIVANWAYTKYSVMRQDIIRHQAYWENKFNAEVPELTGDLTDYACTQAEEVVADWQKLAIYLMTRYRDGQEYKAENEQFLRDRFGQPLYPDRPAYPAEYLKTLAPHTVHE